MNSKWEGYQTTSKVISISIKSHLSKKATNNKIKDIALEYSINNHKKTHKIFLSEMMNSNKEQKMSYQPSNLIYRILQRDKETDSVFLLFLLFYSAIPIFSLFVIEKLCIHCIVSNFSMYSRTPFILLFIFSCQ